MTDDVTPPAPLPDPTRFVLLHTSHAGNVGAAARALKVMGFGDLVLVRPRFADVLQHPDAVAWAGGAGDVLARARIVDDLDEALHGVEVLCGTAMTVRDFSPPTYTPREHLPALSAQRRRVAFLFGTERIGLTNAQIERCHACLTVPTDPSYGSLNLSQAVQVIAYEWRQALGGFGRGPLPRPGARADVAAVRGLLEHWRETLVRIGYLDPALPRRLMARLNRLVNRAQPTPEEVAILRGIARAAADAADAAATPAGGTRRLDDRRRP